MAVVCLSGTGSYNPTLIHTMKKKEGLLNQVDSVRDQIDACSDKKSKNSLLLLLAGLLEKVKKAEKASAGGSG